ncbi:hypothetical protein [Streptomyces marispadix]|uniref:Uncharacterized protein n=1 Tax=Streptomyces marispadix TaxID=2922868 RepID=A0ABS9T207_9ACTN|nr:hypothetical protein [Streptomyces marispadix]MCH6162557.1 hypothetical protein [Streptomyces marispadix]
MSVRRTWRACTAGAPAESHEFHRPGREPMTDLGWIVTLAQPAWPGAEFGLMSHDESASLLRALSVEPDDVNARVPCFFGRAPDGNGVDAVSRR